MKIKHIGIHNFRSIKDLSWEINPGRMEALIGKNSVGKSAIIDALLYLNADLNNIQKDDKPNNIQQETEISLTLELTKQEIDKMGIDVNDYFSKKKEISKHFDRSFIKITKIFTETTSDSTSKFKINNLNLTEFIYQDIQRIEKILAPHKSEFNYKQYSIFSLKKPDIPFHVLLHDFYALKQYYRNNRNISNTTLKKHELITSFDKVMEIIENILNYKKEIQKILPKFVKFDFSDFGIIPNRVNYTKEMSNIEVVKQVFFNMDLKIKNFTGSIGQHHIIKEISKKRINLFENFLSENWIDSGTKIEMKFHPSYMVCSVNDNFVSTTITQRSLGEKWLLSFLIFFFYHRKLNENLIILIDEPSINLHPNIQKRLIQMINSIIEKHSKIYLFYTTHSPYLIPLNNLNKLARVIKTKSTGTKIKKFSFDKILEKINTRFTNTTATIETLEARISQMFTISLREGFFGNGVVLCEGHTERLSFPIWAEILDFSFENSGLILIQVSKFSMINYAEFFDTFGIPVFLIFDNDQDKSKKKKNHILNNKWLISFAGGKVEDYPVGPGKNYFVFNPKYETCLKREDPSYETIEEEVSVQYGTSKKKGIKARYIALEYKEISREPPESIKILFETIKEFSISIKN